MKTLDGQILKDGDDCFVLCESPYVDQAIERKIRKAKYRDSCAIDMGWDFNISDLNVAGEVAVTHIWKEEPAEIPPKIMKGLSVKQPWASLIAEGHKTIETRTYPQKYRGQLLIVSSKKPDDQGPAGQALCIATLVNSRVMTIEDETAAMCDIYEKAHCWDLRDIKQIEKFPVKGQLGIYNVEIPRGHELEKA